MEEGLDVLDGHDQMLNDHKRLSKGVNGINLNGHVDDIPGRGRPNHFYPIDGVYPGALPETAVVRPPLKIA